MIPERAEDLDALHAEIERQHFELEDLFEGVSDEAAMWRPSPDRWSVTGHLAHLAAVNEPYLRAIEATIDKASPAVSDGPFRHPWISTRFVRKLEPPPVRRLKTFRSMAPGPDVEPGPTRESFAALQETLAEAIDRSRDLDLGSNRFGSPFFFPLRLSLGTGFEMVLAHNRRHIWLIRELMERPDFPG